MKLRSILTSAVFLLTIGAFALGHLLTPDKSVSVSERRTLEGFPEFTLQALMSGEFGDDLESYLLDQFPLRDNLRRLKALWHFDVYKQSDNNGIYLAEDHVCKLDDAINDAEVESFLKTINSVYDSYLRDMNVSFALIPDKNYFAADANGYPALDYVRMEQMLADGLDEGIAYYGMTPFESLTLDDYYRTDLHWKQESLQSAVNGLGELLGFTPPDLSAWEQNTYAPFYGSYYGQSALNIEPDTLTTLSAPATDGCIVTSPEYSGEKPVYDAADFELTDGYSLYLGGPLGLVTVENPNGTTGRELILFRDSFGSSLVPLLMESYDKITLVDLRYLASINVGRFVEFTDQDVLFLYSTSIVNNGKTLK